MGYGVEWLSDNTNNGVGASSGWTVGNFDSYFSTPEDIGIVIFLVTNIGAKANADWGVRHPDESTNNYANLPAAGKTLLFCGARDTEVSGSRCQCGRYRNQAANQYRSTVYGGIKRDSCQWDQTPSSFTTDDSSAAWEEINVYSASPPTDAVFAIIEVLDPEELFGVRHPDDTSSAFYNNVNRVAHFLAPIRKDSSTEYYIEVYSEEVEVTFYVRGWIKETNPGIFAKNPIQSITIGTSESDESISQDGYKVTGGFFIGYTLNTPYIMRVVDPDWTNNDEYDIDGVVTLGCSADASENVEVRSETVLQALGLIAFSGSYWPHHPGGVSNPDVGKIGGVDKGKIGKVGGV